MRIRLDVEFDGTDYCGWQRQKDLPSVQQKIEDAILELTQQKVTVHGSSRTDAGVHALCLTCHFDVETRIPPGRISYALNFLLPKDIRIKNSEQAQDGFHARFDAKMKWYRYSILNHPQGSPLYRRTTGHVPYALDLKRMQESLAPLVGTHDYAAFAASGSMVKSTVRTICEIRLTKLGDRIILDVLGSGFLYNMVRIIAGTLIDIGRKKLGTDAFLQMIEHRDRLCGGLTAKPEGLMLMHVFYGEPDADRALFETLLRDAL